jgi:hypothetical protein
MPETELGENFSFVDNFYNNFTSFVCIQLQTELRVLSPHLHVIINVCVNVKPDT